MLKGDTGTQINAWSIAQPERHPPAPSTWKEHEDAENDLFL